MPAPHFKASQNCATGAKIFNRNFRRQVRQKLHFYPQGVRGIRKAAELLTAAQSGRKCASKASARSGLQKRKNVHSTFLNYISICSMTNASTTSPTLMSLYFSKLRPHS